MIDVLRSYETLKSCGLILPDFGKHEGVEQGNCNWEGRVVTIGDKANRNTDKQKESVVTGQKNQ